MWKRFISGDIYRDIPTPLLFVLGPLVGLVYLFLIPLVLVANSILLPFRKARKAGTSETFAAPRPNPQSRP